MKKKYKHIFFDLDNTLWDFEKNSRYAMESTFKSFGLGNTGVSFDSFFEVYSKHNHALWESYRKKEVNKKELIQKRFLNTFTELDISGINSEEINTHYLEEMPKQCFLINGALEIVQYLKGKGYNLYIITNGFKEVQFKKLESSKLREYFKNVFISEVIKTPKPGYEIFEYAITSSNAKKNESIMIGDDWTVDILGAVNAGIDAVHLDLKLNSAFIKDDNITNNNNLYRIGNLEQLRSLL